MEVGGIFLNYESLLFAGAQFGTVISMPLSGLLSASTAGWPSIFYVFGTVGTFWSIAFLWFVYEDPEVHPSIDVSERNYIQKALWGAGSSASVSQDSLTYQAQSTYFKCTRNVPAECPQDQTFFLPGRTITSVIGCLLIKESFKMTH